MKKEVRHTIMLLALGASLVAYAHSNFATIKGIDYITRKIDIIDKRIYELHEKMFSGKK